MIDTLVIATGNAGKLSEIREILGDLGIRLLSLADFPDVVPAVEDAPTLEGNAVLKARIVFESTGLPAIADDTGLEVDALNGAPGVMSARFAGPEANPAKNRTKLLEALADNTVRTARFRTVVAFISSSEIRTFEGICDGHIGHVECGSHGFGYDALFIPSDLTTTFAEMTSEEKNEISHRGMALRKLREYLEADPGIPES